jgi:hypothetical protein
MPDNDNKTVYILVGVGITLLAVIAIFSFMTNRKVEKMSWEAERVQQQNSPVQTLGAVSTVSSVPIASSIGQTQPVIYDEKIYRMLSEKIDNGQKTVHEHLEDVNSNVTNLNNNLKAMNYKIPSLGLNNMDIANKPTRAGSINTIRTTNEDKGRQKDFGMV